MLPALGFLAAVLFVPEWSGAALSPRWIFLSVALPLVLFFRPAPRLTVSHLVGALYVGWALLTILWAKAPGDSVPAVIQLGVLALAFQLGATLERDELERLLVGTALGVAVSSLLTIPQVFGWEGIPQASDPPAGLFVNKNTLGELSALLIVGLVAFRRYGIAALLIPAVLLTRSGAGVLALLAAGFVWWMQEPRRWIAGYLAALALGIAALAVFYVLGSGNLHHRLLIWRDVWDHWTFFGYGLGSFWEAFLSVRTHTFMPGESAAQAHNEVLNALFELGVPGALALTAFALSLMGPPSAAQLVLVALFVEAMFAFPLQLPVNGLVGLACAGHVARLRALAWREPERSGMGLRPFVRHYL